MQFNYNVLGKKEQQIQHTHRYHYGTFTYQDMPPLFQPKRLDGRFE